MRGASRAKAREVCAPLEAPRSPSTAASIPRGAVVSAQDLPALDRALKCALPIISIDPEFPDVPGLIGTCCAFRVRGSIVFVTAAHTLKRLNFAETRLEVPVQFGEGRSEVARIGQVLTPEPSAQVHEDVCDFSVMLPVQELRVPSSVEFHAVDLAEIPEADRAPKGSDLAFAGYPLGNDGNTVEYGSSPVRVHAHLFHGFGRYAARPSWGEGLHTMRVDTSAVGGSNGLSGGPVFLLSGQGVTMAGVMVRGNAGIVHFIDVGFIVEFFRRESLKIEWSGDAR